MHAMGENERTSPSQPLKSSSKALNQMPVRKFVDSLNLKIPEVKIYSFSEQTTKKTKGVYANSDILSAKIDKKNDGNGNSNNSTESSYNKPQSSGVNGSRSRLTGKSMVHSSYKGFHEKMKPERKKTDFCKTEIKPVQVHEEKKGERKNLGIDMLKGEMGEFNYIEGFSESTIRIEQEFDGWDSQRDILEFLEKEKWMK